jgi:hypothetical protein
MVSAWFNRDLNVEDIEKSAFKILRETKKARAETEKQLKELGLQ